MMTATGAMTVYSLLRKALAPSLTAAAISVILGVPGSAPDVENQDDRVDERTSAPPTARRL